MDWETFWTWVLQAFIVLVIFGAPAVIAFMFAVNFVFRTYYALRNVYFRSRERRYFH